MRFCVFIAGGAFWGRVATLGFVIGYASNRICAVNKHIWRVSFVVGTRDTEIKIQVPYSQGAQFSRENRSVSK